MTIVEFLNKQKRTFDQYGIDDGNFYEMFYPKRDLDEFINLHGFKSTEEYEPVILGNVIVFSK